MNPISAIFHIVSFAAIYLLYRTVMALNLRVLKLEQKPKAPVPIKPTEPVKPEPKPISKFNPAPVVTLLPESGRSVEVAPGVFEFK